MVLHEMDFWTLLELAAIVVTFALLIRSARCACGSWKRNVNGKVTVCGGCGHTQRINEPD